MKMQQEMCIRDSLSHGDLLDASLAILQITRGEADVAGTFLGTSDAGAGARAGVLDLSLIHIFSRGFAFSDRVCYTIFTS